MRLIFNVITLPFIGEVNLPASILIIFFVCLLCVVAFEFVNGFHDTADAAATVIKGDVAQILAATNLIRFRTRGFKKM